MPTGLIVKALSGFYYVEEEKSKDIYECRGRGVFRNINVTPLVGDRVSFQVTGPYQGYITEISERKNTLVRPPVANIDQVLLVFSIKKPEFSQLLLDRFLTVIEALDITPIIIITKIDLLEDDFIYPYIDYYQSLGYQVITTSKYDQASIQPVIDSLDGKISVLAGQSGVGKSSLINAINPHLTLKTDEISEALGRGKHTTRHVELFKVNNGLIVDTPGFSNLDFQEFGIDTEILSSSFIEFLELSNDCKFRGCLHINEPSCAVKAKLGTNSVYDQRYEHYKVFHEEIKKLRVIYPRK